MFSSILQDFFQYHRLFSIFLQVIFHTKCYLRYFCFHRLFPRLQVFFIRFTGWIQCFYKLLSKFLQVFFQHYRLFSELLPVIFNITGYFFAGFFQTQRLSKFLQVLFWTKCNFFQVFTGYFLDYTFFSVFFRVILNITGYFHFLVGCF